MPQFEPHSYSQATIPQFEPGVYVIFPKSSNNPPAFAIGPIPASFPSPDVPVKVADKFIGSWTISSAENNTFTVFPGGPIRPDGYKWIVKHKALYASSVSPPDVFRFESAGDGLWKIGLFGQDAVLTLGDEKIFPSLTFKPADGSDAQLFHATKQ